MARCHSRDLSICCLSLMCPSALCLLQDFDAFSSCHRFWEVTAKCDEIYCQLQCVGAFPALQKRGYISIASGSPTWISRLFPSSQVGEKGKRGSRKASVWLTEWPQGNLNLGVEVMLQGNLAYLLLSLLGCARILLNGFSCLFLETDKWGGGEKWLGVMKGGGGGEIVLPLRTISL